MGALIQTKGTQLLANFFNTRVFGPGATAAAVPGTVNLNWLRTQGVAGGSVPKSIK